MDRVMLIDGHNAMWRASVGFGPPVPHGLVSHTAEECANPEKRCMCGAKWDLTDNKCYNEKYVFIFNFFRNLRPLIENGNPDKVFFRQPPHCTGGGGFQFVPLFLLASLMVLEMMCVVH